MPAVIVALLLALATGPRPATAMQDSLTIRLANGTEAERLTRDQILRIVADDDIERWILTRTILIDENAIPHSHPVLTLHTRHLGDDDELLATFLHEQFHWYVDRVQDRLDSAVAEFRKRYPEVPVGNGEGARDEYSTYLHLVVCDLEFQAMTLLRGRERATDVLSRNNHYRWIYNRVLADPTVREVMTGNGLTIR